MERDREAWRQRARKALKAIGRGAQAQCARDIGTNESEVSHLISGRIKYSHWVVPISKWLKIAPPTIGLTNQVQELTELAHRLSPEQVALLVEMGEALDGKK